MVKTRRYLSKWMAKNWDSWKDFLCHTPHSHLLPSRKALPQVTDNTKVAEEYALSTCCLLGLLGRLSLTLKVESCRTNAR
eukprot:12892800-Prorocentrum_lima.AAC.1